MISAHTRLVIAFFLLAALWCVPCQLDTTAADPPRGDKTRTAVKMSPLDRALLAAKVSDTQSSPIDGPTLIPAPARERTSWYRVLQIEFTDERSCERFKLPEGVSAFHRFGRFMDAFVDGDKLAELDTLEKADEIRWIDVGETVFAPLPPKEVETEGASRALLEPIVSGGVEGLTGKGVIIAILDTGVDFRHKDFITIDKDGQPTSRLLYDWDTIIPQATGKPGGKPPLSFPNGAPIGTLYTRDDLTAELRNPTGAIPSPDTNGHGTACAGIAAGNGTGTPEKEHTGVAPGADIIAVRIGSGPSIQNAYLLNAVCSWLDRMAGKKPLVVSCSFGGQFGGHDGAQVSERQLDAQFPLTKKARAICIAAGNEAQRLPHGRIVLDKDKTTGNLTWTPGEYPMALKLYANTDKPDDLVLDLSGYSDPNLDIKRYVHPLSGSVIIEVRLPGSRAERAELQVSSKSGKPLKLDAYFQIGFRTETQGFTGATASKSYLIASPGSSDNAITVGSYDFNDVVEKAGIRIHLADTQGKPMKLGALSSYSNRGYLRLRDTVKPDIVAPGQWHIAPAVAHARRYDPDLKCEYRVFNGTSAATPYTAGVIALLMERNPDITNGAIKDLFRNCATQDRATGKTPNTDWGNGKLDYAAVKKMIKRAKPTAPPAEKP